MLVSCSLKSLTVKFLSAIDGKQDLVIAFRGTVTSTEWMADIDAFLVNALPWNTVFMFSFVGSPL